MADVNYSVVDFSDLSAVSDGKTLLYTDGQVCKSENNLSELIQSAVDKQVENKLDTSAFSTVSGNFLTAHQQIPESANWTETFETVTANSETWNNVSSIKSFTIIAGIEAETSADSLQITNGDNVSITTENKTITISAKDTTYDENDFIGASHLNDIVKASGYADDWNTNKSNVVLASGYAKNWSDNSATIIAKGNSGVSALNTITTNSAAWSNGAFVTATLTPGENPVPDIQEPTNKVIYLTKEEGSTKTDPYTEWIYSDKWEIIGETTVDVDLSDYYTKSETSGKDQLSTEFNKKLDSSEAATTYLTKSDAATTYQPTGNYLIPEDITGKLDKSIYENASGHWEDSYNVLTANSANGKWLTAHQSLEEYYTKSETSGSTEISDALSGKEDKIFVAEYNVTSYADIKAAYDAGKQIVCKYVENESQTKFMPLSQYVASANIFIFVGWSTLGDSIYVHFSLNSDGIHTDYQVLSNSYYAQTETSGRQELTNAFNDKQDKLSFGYDSSNAISSINTSAIAAGGSIYTAGTDIKIENDTISVNNMECSAVTNNYSVAIGLSTSALSYGSFTQGENTLADTGRAAHAEGNATQALANYSHSEGSNTVASGEDSHSEGYYTRATERYSHSEGRATSAQGEDSHAEGYSTSAVGKHAHAEGEYSKATGETSHSEGYDTSAIGNYAHAEGYFTIANSNCSHSEGQETSALGFYSHAEGYRTKAGSMYMHVCGKYNQTSSNALFVVGNGSANNSRSDAFIVTSAGVASANDFISNGVSLSGMLDLYNILTARPVTGTYTLKCVNGILSWVEDSNVPANAVGLNNEPVGVNGDYFTVGEGQ